MTKAKKVQMFTLRNCVTECKDSIDALEVAIRTCDYPLYVMAKQNVESYLKLIDLGVEKVRDDYEKGLE